MFTEFNEFMSLKLVFFGEAVFIQNIFLTTRQYNKQKLVLR